MREVIFANTSNQEWEMTVCLVPDIVTSTKTPLCAPYVQPAVVSMVKFAILRGYQLVNNSVAKIETLFLEYGFQWTRVGHENH